MKPLQPLRSNKVWGYEDWIASTHKDGPQKDFIELTQNYPLLVKIIQADDTLSVQVHPDDQTASLLEGKNERGKTECWYVLDAEEGSALVYGLKKDYTAEEITQALKNNTVEGYLNTVQVKKGDFIFIPAGTVHAIGGGLRLLEVQQCCNITYRLYDWGRTGKDGKPRPLHVEEALKTIDLSLPAPQYRRDVACPFFAFRVLENDGVLEVPANVQTFTAVFVVNEQKSILVPANCATSIKCKGKVLVTTL